VRRGASSQERASGAMRLAYAPQVRALAAAAAIVRGGIRVLVTNGARFIGSSVAIARASRHPGWDLVACDNLHRAGFGRNLPRLRGAGVELVRADVRHAGDLARIGRSTPGRVLG